MLAYRYGGGAFLVPYGFALVFAAIPMVVLEFALGQSWQRNHVGVMMALSPKTAGLGWAAVAMVLARCPGSRPARCRRQAAA